MTSNNLSLQSGGDSMISKIKFSLFFISLLFSGAASAQEQCSFDSIRFEAPSCFARDSGSKPNSSCTVSYTAPDGYVIVESDEKLWENLHATMRAPDYVSVNQLRQQATENPENTDLTRRAEALASVVGFNSRAFNVSVEMRGSCAQECLLSNCNCRVGVAIPMIIMPASCLNSDSIRIQ